MDARAKLFGHPVHPMLIVFPLGLLSTSLIFDLIGAFNKNGNFNIVAYWMIVGGLLGGFLAAIFGVVDFLAIPQGTRARRLGLFHGLGNAVVLLLFLGSFALRVDSPSIPGVVAIGLSAAGVGLALLTGWLGGELVDRLAVGVDEGAHLNSPNSLSGRPASEEAGGVHRKSA